MFALQTKFVMPGLLFFAVVSTATLAAAQATGIKHPVLDHSIKPKNAASYEKAVVRVMAMSEREMLAFMPERHYARFCECPKCYGGVQGYESFKWSIQRPDELQCKFCGTVVHPNPAYPEDQVMTGKNSLGDTITHHFYYNPERKMRHFFTDQVAMYKRNWLLSQCRALGVAYQATGKEEYARRVVLVLDRIAQVYPRYAVMSVGSMPVRHFKFAASQDPPYRWDCGKWGWHAPSDDMPAGVIKCYDLVYDSPQFDQLSQERGYDVRKKFENDFLRDTFAAVSANRNHVTNYVAYLSVAARMGRVMGEPRFVHWAFYWMKQNVYAGCFYDGMWHESPSYHYMTTSGLRSCFASVGGYCDPPDYVDPVDGTRLDSVDPDKDVPCLARVWHAPEAVDFPNGCSTPVHDTWAGSQASQPRDRTVSTILPGFGHASLGRGAGTNQMQAQLHFSGAYGHHHLDNLHLTLFAKGREMLSDIGYTWTNVRWWPTGTFSHNTVAVDGKNQTSKASDGDLLWFFPEREGVAVVEADGKRGYGQIEDLDTYRRLLVMIPVSDANAYVVDVFRTRGGSVHDWLLHGDADEDMTAACSVPLTENPGQMDAKGTKAYGLMREVRSVDTDEGFCVTFGYTAKRDDGVRIHLLGGPRTRVYLAQSPSVRRAGRGGGGDNRKALDFWMPQLIVRRGGPAPFESTFVAVEEPFDGKPFIESVTPLPLTPADPSGVALRVKHGNTLDTVISTLDGPPFPTRTTGDGISLKGRLAIVRQQAGKVTGLWLFEGETLSTASTLLTTKHSSYGGRILSALRESDGDAHDALITDVELPLGGALHGAWMIVTHGNGFRHGYHIDRVEKRNGKTAILLQSDHGLRISDEQTEEVFFPQREIRGENTFVIPLAAATSGS